MQQNNLNTRELKDPAEPLLLKVEEDNDPAEISPHEDDAVDVGDTVMEMESNHWTEMTAQPKEKPVTTVVKKIISEKFVMKDQNWAMWGKRVTHHAQIIHVVRTNILAKKKWK